MTCMLPENMLLDCLIYYHATYIIIAKGIFSFYHYRYQSHQFHQNRKVRVKFTGDGTNMGKRLHVVNFEFTILDEGDLACSAMGNHCLAIFKEPEMYETLKNAL